MKATDEWSAMEDQVESSTDGVNFYNIQIWGGSEKRRSLLFARKNLTSFGEYTFVQGVFVMTCEYVSLVVCMRACVHVCVCAYMNYGERKI